TTNPLLSPPPAAFNATLTMNLVSRKMVIEELKDKFLVRRTRMEVGKLGKPYPLLNLAYVGV
ncbi:hypothetical protein, partial [Amycolatopsis sp. NPDC051372]|uniref:hypothetical protein n=1 Tax=Amycolatopsis sp. NPDC051372 TaxID=3155669 RepID=UPI003440A234